MQVHVFFSSKLHVFLDLDLHLELVSYQGEVQAISEGDHRGHGAWAAVDHPIECHYCKYREIL